MSGWPVSYADGKLVFPELGDYTIPNAAVTWDGEGLLDLLFPEFVGGDRNASTSIVTFARGEKSKRANIPLKVHKGAASDGTPAVQRARQLYENLDELNQISRISKTGDGTQTVEVTLWPGATQVDLTVVVEPLVRGSVIPGAGCRAGLVMVVVGGAIQIPVPEPEP